MNLKTILERLRETVPRYTVDYAIARERQTALAPYPTALTALEAMRGVIDLESDLRGELVLAVVHEQQIKPHPLWQAMLVCAFAPMLRRLRKRLGGPDRPDLDQEVLVRFFDAIHSLPRAAKPAFTALELKRATARATFRAAGIRPVSLDEPFDEETYPADPFADAIQRAIVDASAAEAADVIEAGGTGGDLLDVVLATFAREPTLKAFVLRTYPDATDEERAEILTRLHESRRRLRARLRASHDFMS